MLIGEKIQYLRKQNGLSQEQFADKLGVTRQACSKWEIGDSIPDIENIVLISKLFNVTTDSLLIDTVSLDSKKEDVVVVEEKRVVKIARNIKEFIQKYFYIAGYILIIIGVINTLFSVCLTIIWNDFSNELSKFLLQYDIPIRLDFAFWLFIYMGFVALFIILIGVVIVKKKKK